MLDLVAGHQPVRWIGLEGRLGWMKTNVGPGTGNRPSADMIFDPTQIPGLLDQTDFLRTEAGLYVAGKTDPNMPQGTLGLRFARFKDQTLKRFTFNRFSADGPLGHCR